MMDKISIAFTIAVQTDLSVVNGVIGENCQQEILTKKYIKYI